MTLMLVALFASLGLGLFARQFGRRESAICVIIAAALTLLYYVHPSFMT